MKHLEYKIPFRSVGMFAPMPEVIRQRFNIETTKMMETIRSGHTIYIRLDWGVLVESCQHDPYLASE
jgi:hypothetical protein